MNEKIEELIEEAGIQTWEDEWSGETVFGGDSVKLLERFAELIVQECSEVARHTILTGSGVDPDKFTGTVTTVQQIKRHFEIKND